MIDEHTYIHQGINYTFRVAKDRFNGISLAKSVEGNFRSYYTKIMSGAIPQELFNDPLVMRCSSFRLSGLRRGAIPQLSQDFIERGLIQVIKRRPVKSVKDPIAQIPGMVAEVFTQFKKNGFSEKPGHDTILRNLLIRNEAAVSMETPIWNPYQFRAKIKPIPNQSVLPIVTSTKLPDLSKEPRFTGHIDLVLYSQADNCIIISDYKPEGEYLRSLPQVAFYGLYFQYQFRLAKIKCMSFNKEDAWVYDPNILTKEIAIELPKYGTSIYPWQRVFEKWGKNQSNN